MKKLLAIAILLLASTAAAQAQYSFEVDGRTIRIDPDRGTVSIPGVYDNTPRRSKRAKGEDAEQKRKPAAKEVKTDPQPAPAAPPAAAAAPAPAPAAAPPPAAAPADSASTAVAVAPSDPAATALPPPAPPPVRQDAAPAAKPAPAPAVAAAPPAAAPKPAAPAVQAANSPLGVWLTEEKDGKVRIEQCGANLCGYAVDKKTSQNREQVLINMKPGKDKWSGRIVDPSSGSSYDSTIALKGPDTLRVQGCAFGGMFCGGQTWTRVN
ncbi:DUF2147 domain-containing protein [Bradyrhizobium sp. CCBAU 51753]|uniref:DUF2147 domain-containing protein n=1 Tax=Bradyrhizobium sp. CCBAU 51753 TaxID=1325100 RepID=UPI00188A5A0D|nr:DUF2147 domain-containing protein [Bradyrhizobium sp. CCBAU 51753]QOZ26021.1 DUF2147 domain-containing protein [Bradyrhizobium sp. CCBAU 51753]